MRLDIQEFFTRVIYQNNTIIDSLTSRSTLGRLVMFQEKLVEEATDTLPDNGICGLK